MSDLDPVRRPGEFVFVLGGDPVAAEATVREDEGLTISCKVLAGIHHDHLLVPAGRADEALELLRGLRW